MSTRLVMILIVGQVLIDVAIAFYGLTSMTWQNHVTDILINQGL